MENAQAIDESLRKNQPNDLVVSRTDFEKLVDADDALLRGMDKAAHVLDRLADPTLQSSGVEEIKEMCRHFVKDIETSQSLYLEACASQAQIPYRVDPSLES